MWPCSAGFPESVLESVTVLLLVFRSVGECDRVVSAGFPESVLESVTVLLSTGFPESV